MDTPKHRDLIYDIGMHKGEDAEFYLRKGFRVVAIEANPELVSLCRDRLKEFIDKGQLTIVEGAILDPAVMNEGQRKVSFYRNDDVSVWGTVCSNWAERNAKVGTSSSLVDVEVINFANVLMEHGMPYYMKIDIEGCDMVCVKALASFRVRPNYLSLESDKTSFINIKREVEALIELGYDKFQAVEQSAIPMLQSPPKPAREGKYASQRFEEGSSGLFGAELVGDWKSRNQILRRYRAIHLGYRLLGDDGMLNRLKFRGSKRLRNWTARFLGHFTGAAVPGWYDTHARHSSAGNAAYDTEGASE